MSVTALALIATFVTAWGLTGLFGRPKRPVGPLDHPNPRSLHHLPRPRSGGLAMVAGLTVGSVLWAPGELAPLGLALLPGVLVAAVDDWRALSFAPKLLGQGLTAGLLLALWLPPPGLTGLPTPLEGVLWGVFIVATTNFYNFMDGLDGLAATMAVVGFASLAGLGLVAGQVDYAALCALIALAAGGFLVFNWPPARIFMGDVGSTTLGALVGVMVLAGAASGVASPPLALLPFAPFGIDAGVTLAVRLWRREAVWRAHRQHYYQRLALMGVQRRAILWGYGGLMVAGGLSAFGVCRSPELVQHAIVGLWVVIYGLVIAHLEARLPARSATATPSGENPP
ncbi:MAG: hypothetical protein ACFCBW_08440 [Candidatus Competibacterales bacterium]